MAIGEAELERWFGVHQVDGEQLVKITAIKHAAREFAKVVVANTPGSADQTTALRKIREAVFCADSAVVCGGK